jgi:septal ring factor EnvC (AmiA/AmiB activator)
MKKVFSIIGGIILGAIGIFLATRKSDNAEKIEKVDAAIKEKEEKVEEVKQEAEKIQKRRKKTKKNIHQSKAKTAQLEEAKANIQVERPVDAEAAKTNILNKTNRGRKPKQA